MIFTQQAYFEYDGYGNEYINPSSKALYICVKKVGMQIHKAFGWFCTVRLSFLQLV
jgi:hypothetical protein